MHVSHDRLAAAERHVQGAVVQLVLPLLVEPDGDVEHARSGDARAIQRVQIVCERAGRDRDFAHAAFKEIAGERGLGETQHLRPWR